MRARTMFLFLTAVLCTGLFVCSGSAEPRLTADGRMIVSAVREGEIVRVVSVAIVEGAPPLPLSGAGSYRLIDSSGRQMDAGPLEIPRFIVNCKAGEDGAFNGGIEPLQEPFVLILPYYREATRLELRQPGQAVASVCNLEQTRRTRIASAAANLQLPPPDFRGYFKETVPAAPEPLPVSAARHLVMPAAGNLQGTLSISGLPTGYPWAATIQLYNGVTGAFISSTSASNNTNGSFTFNVGSGTYALRTWLWTYEPTFGNKPVPVYPFPQTSPVFSASAPGPAANAGVSFTFHPLVKGTVKRGSTAVPCSIYIIYPKKQKSVLNNDLVANLSSTDGSFALRIPAGKYPFVTVPWQPELAADQLAIYSVPAGGLTNLAISLPALPTATGDALKRIWPASGASVDPSDADPGKFNILFMAEGYTANNESFTDGNGNGNWDGDLLLDENGNGALDTGEYYYDRNRDRAYNKPEAFNDSNGDGICNRFERAKFELRAATNTAAMLNYLPYNKNASRFNVYTWWVASTHGMEKFTNATPWMNMNTYFGVYCNETGGFQSGRVDAAKVAMTASSILPAYTVAVVLVQDPMNAMRANAIYGFGRILLSANDLRGGATFVHEAGHSFYSMGDEYIYTEGSTYGGAEPNEPNLTIQTNLALVKWKKYIKGTPPVPTPYAYDGFGLVEGGAYGSHGIYRPTGESMMRSTDYGFTKMQQTLIKNVLKAFTK